jgi:hypothetical protein
MLYFEGMKTKYVYEVQLWYSNDPSKPGAPSFLQTYQPVSVVIELSGYQPRDQTPRAREVERIVWDKAVSFSRSVTFARLYPWVDPETIFSSYDPTILRIRFVGPLVG